MISSFTRNLKNNPTSKLVGTLLMVGGLAAGITLVSQPQLLNQKAAGVFYSSSPRATPIPSGLINCGGQYCAPYNCHCVDEDPCTRVACRRGTPTATPRRTPTRTPSRTPMYIKTRTPTPRFTLRPGFVNCGGSLCRENDCHCQGGDPCVGFKCEPNIRASCQNQGRSWCDNYLPGPGKTCCEVGYVCNPTGEGCVKKK